MTALHRAVLLVPPLASDRIFCYNYIAVTWHRIQAGLYPQPTRASVQHPAFGIYGINTFTLALCQCPCSIWQDTNLFFFQRCFTGGTDSVRYGTDIDGVCHAGFSVNGIAHHVTDAVFVVGSPETLGFPVNSDIHWLYCHWRRVVPAV